jgi:AcrR family transcriptional regulator
MTSMSTTPAAPSAPMTKRRRRTREKLVEAARAVFADHGTAVGVADICEAAGFTRGAFYSNFSDKDELLRAVMEPQLEETIAQIEEMMAWAEDTSDPAALVERFLGVVNLDRDLFLIRSELALAAARDPAEHAAELAPLEQLLERLTEAIVAALAQHGLRFSVDPGDAVRMLAAVADHSHQQSLIRQTDDATRLARVTMPAIVAAITEPMG